MDKADYNICMSFIVVGILLIILIIVVERVFENADCDLVKKQPQRQGYKNLDCG